MNKPLSDLIAVRPLQVPAGGKSTNQIESVEVWSKRSKWINKD